MSFGDIASIPCSRLRSVPTFGLVTTCHCGGHASVGVAVAVAVRVGVMVGVGVRVPVGAAVGAVPVAVEVAVGHCWRKCCTKVREVALSTYEPTALASLFERTCTSASSLLPAPIFTVGATPHAEPFQRRASVSVMP